MLSEIVVTKVYYSENEESIKSVAIEFILRLQLVILINNPSIALF